MRTHARTGRGPEMPGSARRVLAAFWPMRLETLAPVSTSKPAAPRSFHPHSTPSRVKGLCEDGGGGRAGSILSVHERKGRKAQAKGLAATPATSVSPHPLRPRSCISLSGALAAPSPRPPPVLAHARAMVLSSGSTAVSPHTQSTGASKRKSGGLPTRQLIFSFLFFSLQITRPPPPPRAAAAATRAAAAAAAATAPAPPTPGSGAPASPSAADQARPGGEEGGRKAAPPPLSPSPPLPAP